MVYFQNIHIINYAILEVYFYMQQYLPSLDSRRNGVLQHAGRTSTVSICHCVYNKY